MYKMSVADGTTVVLKNNIKPYFKSLNVGRSVFTDGNCVLYSSDNEERCSWFMYDCSTGTETFVMEAATCAGFTEDGRVLFGCKKQSEFSEKMIYKEFDLKTNKTNLFMPWIRFLSPNVFNDTYIQNTHDTGYGSVICEPHLVSLKTSCAYYLPNIDVSSVDGIWLTVLEIFSYA
ncbi:MAG: hypothetical protein IJB86_00280 [Clostridia bacterium]|nr:hypothetical protein [Clostridia bacterium]